MEYSGTCVIDFNHAIAIYLIALYEKTGKVMCTLNDVLSYIQLLSNSDCEMNYSLVFLQDKNSIDKDYFTVINNCIFVAEGKTIDDLRSRYVGYIPFDVIVFMINVSNDFVEKSKEKVKSFN